MDSLWQDVRHSARSLARQPGFAAAAILSLALGIGANTAIFSALSSFLLEPLPVRNVDRTVYLFHSTPERPDRGLSFPAFERYRQRTDLFSDVMAYTGARPMLMGAAGNRESVYAEPVTSGFFSLTTAGVHLGRPFDATADRTAEPALITVLSHRFWQRRFGADPGVVG